MAASTTATTMAFRGTVSKYSSNNNNHSGDNTSISRSSILKNRSSNNNMMVNKKIKKSVRFSQTKNDDDREDEVNVTIHVPVLPPRGGHEDSRFPLLLPNLLQHRQREKNNNKLLWWSEDELRDIWERSFEEFDSIINTMKQEQDKEQDDAKNEEAKY